MDFIKNNIALIAIVLVVLILVMVRSLGTDYFKTDAIKRAEPSLSKTNIKSLSQIDSLAGDKLIINLDTVNEELVKPGIRVLDISPASILDKNNIKSIKKHKGPVLLFSNEPEVSIRLWMLLSQLGYSNLYVLTTESDNEVLKYKFQPDTL
jgi:hypothetical protein